MLSCCGGCSDRARFGQPSSKERRRIESMLQLTLPAGTDFKLRKHISGMDPVQLLVFDVPRSQAETLLTRPPLAGNLKDGDRSARPIPPALDPRVTTEEMLRRRLDTDHRPIMNTTRLKGQAATVWNPDGAIRFKFGLYETTAANSAVVHVFVDLDDKETARFYIVCMQ